MQISKHPIYKLLLAIAVILGMAGPTAAANLTIYPVGVILNAQKPAGEINLQNDDEAPKVIQIELMEWSQKNGQDIYTPSRDLLVNPPVFTLQPGKTQLIRLGLNKPSKNAEELAYRLYINEVPPPPKPGFTGLQMALRVGIPIFVEPQQPAKPKLEWQASRNGDGNIQLTVTNTGNVHMKLLDFDLKEAEQNRTLAKESRSFYLLPGQSRELSFIPEFDWQGNSLKLSTNTGRGLVETALALEKAQP
ncbi:MAG: molecular chaperone [Betaproteobacteria bacterium HGW-Betaproteobacteria-1]|jgi:fimbrial chaperone protein|nr:MAG: molecular chaperone [Betaproteobacteria bacterium HGW-Betaproteobacteria-1]